jgi:hypothetical protein
MRCAKGDRSERRDGEDEGFSHGDAAEVAISEQRASNSNSNKQQLFSRIARLRFRFPVPCTTLQTCARARRFQKIVSVQNLVIGL